MDVKDKIENVEKKLLRISDLMITLMYIRANNSFMLYSDNLTKQIGRSYAANGYNIIANGMFEIEVARVCALWDRVNNERQAMEHYSLPAIAYLISTEEVGEILAERICSNIDNEQRFKLKIQEIRKKIQKAIKRVREIESSKLHLDLGNFRNKHIAHALSQTSSERNGKVFSTKYGQEGELFDLTIEVFNEFSYVINNSGTAWRCVNEQAQRDASALWSNCVFNISK